MITECSLIENLTYIQLLGILCKDILYKLLYKTVRILWSNFLKTVNLSMVEESLSHQRTFVEVLIGVFKVLLR